MTTPKTRVGQCKLTDDGAIFCIAEGDGYVMARRKGSTPLCMESVLWDEKFDYQASDDQKLIPHEPHPVEPLSKLLVNNAYP